MRRTADAIHATMGADARGGHSPILRPARTAPERVLLAVSGDRLDGHAAGLR